MMIVPSERKLLDEVVSYLGQVEDSIQVCYDKFASFEPKINSIQRLVEGTQSKVADLNESLMTFRSRILQLEGIIDQLLEREEEE